MNIIIVGIGKIGQKMAEYLCNDKHNITVIDINYEVLQDMVNTYDIKGVEGNGTNIEVLRDAGIEDADIVIAVTGSDEVNLLTCLIARKLRKKCDTIARVRNPEYKKNLQLFKNDLGLAMVVNPEYTAARQIARILRFPSAIQMDNFAKGRVEILKFNIQPNSPLCDTKVADISKKLKSEILVCGVERENEAYIPGGDFILRNNDKISIVATLRNAEDFIRSAKIKTNRVKDTMIIGGGVTSEYLTDILIKSGINVKIIEKDKKRCDMLCSLVPGATIINADASDSKILLEEGIETADSCVALTNIDEENILLSLYAKSVSNGKIITKINKISFDEVVNNLGLDTVISPKDLAAEAVVKFVRAKNNSIGNNIETMHYILDEKAEALEFRIVEKSPLVNKSIAELSLKNDIIIACINRDGKIIIPNGQDMILPGDTVIIVTTHKGFTDIKDILR